MRLITERFGEVDDVTEEHLGRVLISPFGKFAALLASEDDFIQCGYGYWWPGAEVDEASDVDRDGDALVLEYREGSSGRLFRARGRINRDTVLRAFLSYLGRGEGWQRAFQWQELEM